MSMLRGWAIAVADGLAPAHALPGHQESSSESERREQEHEAKKKEVRGAQMKAQVGAVNSTHGFVPPDTASMSVRLQK